MIYKTHSTGDLVSSKCVKAVSKWVLFSFIKCVNYDKMMHEVVNHHLSILGSCLLRDHDSFLALRILHKTLHKKSDIWPH